MAINVMDFRLLMILCMTLAFTVSEPAPPPTFTNPYEKATNQTIDQLITLTMGGTHPAANQIMDFGEDILAELDMFLSKEQFLNMYEPPQPEEMMSGTICDQYLRERKKREAEDTSSERQKRKAVKDTTLRWSDGVMPYKFAAGHFDRKEEYMMRRAMTEWERYTCVRFRPSTNTDKNSVHFQNGIGCNSQLGMRGGIQMLNLQAPGCRYKGLYLHEIGHALGLVHEHQLPNRDQFIRIVCDNVSPQMQIWFRKYTSEVVDQMNVQYQLSSVMHYGITAFSKDGKSQTIQAVDRNKEETIGRVYLKELAYTDAQIVNYMYGCADHCADKTKCGPNGHLNQNCECICEDGSSDCDRTKGGSNGNCVNLYEGWSCYIWANQGECERNSLYMTKYCKKACHACGDSDDSGSCKDEYDEPTCRTWKARGDCVTNAGWMDRNCRSTCNLCDGNSRPEINCEDSFEEKEKCPGWAVKGECQVNPPWMFKNCRKSCHMCDKDGVEEGGDGGGDEDKLECVNTHKTCEKWAESNECANNPDWMINNCRKACNKCDDGECKNLYDDTKCEIFQQKEACLTNSEWMLRFCAKACKTGPCANTGGEVTTAKVTTGPHTKTTVRPVTVSPTCKNRHNSDTQCEIWAKNDHCSINPTWMLKYCSRACGSCPGTTSRTTPKPVTTTDVNGEIPVHECIDTNSQCATWAEHGYCDKTPRYNLVHCKKSCDNCHGCRDSEMLCSVWAEAGHCAQNARYMLRHCQKSCRVCFIKASEMEQTNRNRTTTTGGNKDPGNSSSHKHPIVLFHWLMVALSSCLFCVMKSF